MNEENKEKLRRLANLSKTDIRHTEESVKMNFVVPVLECFGHKGLDFEDRYKDIVIKKNLPKSSKVIVETKNYDKDLNKELQQLERYCGEEHPLLGIIANGHEIRIFSPSWRFRHPFRDTLIYYIKRENLNDENIINSLEKILSRENLESGKSEEFVIERENEIKDAEQEIHNIEKEFKEEEKDLKDKIEKSNQKIEDIKLQIKNFGIQIDNVKSKKDGKIKEVWKELGLPIPSIPVENPPIVAGKLPQVGQSVVIKLPKPRSPDRQPSWRRHNLIPVPKDSRYFFPGLKIEFSVDTDIEDDDELKKLKMYVTSASKGTPIGDPVAGWYIKGDTIKWLRHYSELKPGDMIKFTVIEPHKKYRLESLSE
jgi:hypothetical protein